jgi:hypothetical protein
MTTKVQGIKMNKENISICSKCGKKIFLTKNKENKIFKPKICAECFVFNQKIIQKFCVIFAFLGIIFGFISFFPLSQKIQLIVSIVMFCISFILLVFLFILKIISKKIEIEI